jgi:hypothetical protein
MSAQTEAPTTVGFTAARHRADALLILLNARFVDPSQTPGAMRVLGLDKSDMADARRRVGGMVAASPAPAPPPAPSEPSYWDANPAPFRRPNKSPTTARPIHEGQLRCSQCQKWKDEEEFSLRTDRLGSGTRRSACKDCHRLAGRKRYLNVQAKASLSTLGVEFVVEEGDTSARFICAKCGQPIEPNDDATVVGEVEHSWCAKEEG